MTTEQSKLSLDLPLILPDVPDARDRCVRSLVALLAGREGLAKVHVLPSEGVTPAKLCIHFDPARLSLTRVRELALAAGASLTAPRANVT